MSKRSQIRIGSWSVHHPRLTLAAWIGFVTACVVLGAISGTKTLDNGAVGESARGYAIMNEHRLWGPPRELAYLRARRGPVPSTVTRCCRRGARPTDPCRTDPRRRGRRGASAPRFDDRGNRRHLRGPGTEPHGRPRSAPRGAARDPGHAAGAPLRVRVADGGARPSPARAERRHRRSRAARSAQSAVPGRGQRQDGRPSHRDGRRCRLCALLRRPLPR